MTIRAARRVRDLAGRDWVREAAVIAGGLLAAAGAVAAFIVVLVLAGVTVF